MKPAVLLAHLRRQKSPVGVSGAAKGNWEPRTGQGSWQYSEKLSFPGHRAGKGHITEKYTTEVFSFLWMKSFFPILIFFS